MKTHLTIAQRIVIGVIGLLFGLMGFSNLTDPLTITNLPAIGVSIICGVAGYFLSGLIKPREENEEAAQANEVNGAKQAVKEFGDFYGSIED